MCLDHVKQQLDTLFGLARRQPAPNPFLKRGEWLLLSPWKIKVFQYMYIYKQKRTWTAVIFFLEGHQCILLSPRRRSRAGFANEPRACLSVRVVYIQRCSSPAVITLNKTIWRWSSVIHDATWLSTYGMYGSIFVLFPHMIWRMSVVFLFFGT